MNVLITGGTGYIGSHVTTELLMRGHKVTVFSHPADAIYSTIAQIEALTGSRPAIIRGDIRNPAAVLKTVQSCRPDVVIHLAGMKIAEETQRNKKMCFDTNVGGTYNVLQALEKSSTRMLIMGSSLTASEPFENMSLIAQSKYVAEKMCQQAASLNSELRIVNMRYSIVCGTHASGFLGEDEDTWNYSPLIYFARVACIEKLRAYLIPCIRDYVHVQDVVSAHLLAIEYLRTHRGITTVDVGSGIGTPMDTLLHNFEECVGVKIPFEMMVRPNHITESSIADPMAGWALWGWKPTIDLTRICRDMWYAYTTGACGKNTAPTLSRIATCRLIW